MVADEKDIPKSDPSYPVNDDAMIERMKRYYKVEDHGELLKFIKTQGMRRHIDILDETKSG
jgi:hypothetical protein